MMQQTHYNVTRSVSNVPLKPLDPRWVIALSAAQRLCEILSGGFKLMAEALNEIKGMR